MIGQTVRAPPQQPAAFDPHWGDWGRKNVVESEADLPPAAVSEIAAILAHGYLRYRASLRRAQPVPEPAAPPQRPAPDTGRDTGLAFPRAQSVHVTVVNAQSKGEKR